MLPLHVRKRNTGGGDSVDSICQLNYTDIGNRIKKCRKDKKITQEKLAELIEVSSNTISMIENGNQSFMIDKLNQFAKVFDVTTDYLLYGEIEEKKEQVEQHRKDELKRKIYDELDYCSEIGLIKLLAGLQAANKIA